MSLKTYRYPEVPGFMKTSTGELRFGEEIAPTYKLLAIHNALANGSTTNPTSLIAVKIDTNRNEISRTTLATTLIVYDSTTDQYLIDNNEILSTLLNECIYYLEFQNGKDLFQTEPFLVQEMTFKITADNILKTADNTVYRTNDTNFTI